MCRRLQDLKRQVIVPNLDTLLIEAPAVDLHARTEGAVPSSAGAVTVNVKRARAPGAASRKGCDAGVTVQPAGASSRTVPARARAAVSSTVTGRAAPGANSRTLARKRSETGAMTCSRRCSAGLAGSAAGLGSPAIVSEPRPA